jgi:L-iditol 2-dehydrogenase
MIGQITDEFMKAQLLTNIECLEYKDIPIPEFKSDEILVRIITAAICNGSDPNILKGDIPMQLPCVFGHEPFGEIIACGDEVKELKVGDRISWWCSLGAFGEYAIVNPSKVAVARPPQWVEAKEAPILELVCASARAVKAASVSTSSRVLIIGLGPSGLIMSQLFKAQGVSKVVGWDLYPMRREKGIELGCAEVFDSALVNVGTLTGNAIGEVDIIIDAMGDDILPGEPTLDRAIKLLAPGGKVVSYGHPSRGRKFNPYELQSRNAVICGPEQHISEIQKLMDKCMEFLASGKINLKSLVSAELPLEEVEKGLRMVIDHPDKYLKIIINIGER